MHEYESALQQFDKAIERNRKDADCFQARALCLVKLFNKVGAFHLKYMCQ